MSAIFQHIAGLASSLSHAELRVLLDLAVRTQASSSWQVGASSREMAQSTGLSRASVQTAIDSLNQQRLIRSDAGSATRSAIHTLLFCAPSGLTAKPVVAQISVQGGPTAEPLVAQKIGQGGLMVEPEVAQISGQGGPTAGPGVAQNLGQGGLTIEPAANEKSSTYEPRYKENTSTRTESIDSDIDKTIDRLQNAKKSDFEETLFEHARQQIASHHAKFARPENKQSGLPDDTITAQFLAITDWPGLERIFYDLAAERKEAGHSYAWYVTVALQRIHGISPQRLRDLRTRLKPGTRTREIPTLESSARRADETLPHRPVDRQPVRSFRRGPDVEQLKQQIRALAATRSL